VSPESALARISSLTGRSTVVGQLVAASNRDSARFAAATARAFPRKVASPAPALADFSNRSSAVLYGRVMDR